MQLIDIEAILRHYHYQLPHWLIPPLRRLIHERELNTLLCEGHNLSPQNFLRHILQKLNISYAIHGTPPSASQPYLFVANHPFGGIDGIILAEVLLHHYSDVGVIVNDMLMHIAPLRPLWIPVNKYGAQSSSVTRNYYQALSSHSKQILTFPAGVCSRWRNGRVCDLDWSDRFVKDALRYNRQIIPVFISGELSSRFYLIYRLRKLLRIKTNLELPLLVDELFRQRGDTVDIHFGTPIDICQIEGDSTTICNAIRHEVESLAQ